MCKVKFLSIFVALAIIASAAPVYAEGGNPPSNTVPIVGSVISNAEGNITNADLAKVVDLIMANQITVEQLGSFMAKLDKQQLETMRVLFSERTGVTIHPVDLKQAEAIDVSPLGMQVAASYAYVETIENVWTWNYNPKIFASFWYTDRYCDGDPNDNEYVFYYSVSTSPSTKGNLRWTTTNPIVYAAFMLAYGGNLSAFGYSYSEVRLCIGDTGVAAAGGASAVGTSVFVHY
jgi:hypothetical protein